MPTNNIIISAYWLVNRNHANLIRPLECESRNAQFRDYGLGANKSV